MYQNYFQPNNTLTRPSTTSMVNTTGLANQMVPAVLKGRPVSSFDEVRATAIDFDGSIFFFPDMANKKIYTKQINMDGTASFNVYELQAAPSVESTQIMSGNNYITRTEFESAMNQIQSIFDQIKNKTGTLPAEAASSITNTNAAPEETKEPVIFKF